MSLQIDYCNVSLRFGDKNLFENFNTKVVAGEPLLLATPSGAGKSTLLKATIGLFMGFTGLINVGGTSVKGEQLQRIRQQINYLGQHLDYGGMGVQVWVDQLSDLAHNRGRITDVGLQNMLDLFELPPAILQKQMNELSGGEKTRLALALIACLDRPYILLDEPTAALDESLKNTVVDWVTSKSDTVFVIASHDKIWRDLSSVQCVTTWTAV